MQIQLHLQANSRAETAVVLVKMREEITPGSYNLVESGEWL